jgi:hypothetical protein
MKINRPKFRGNLPLFPYFFIVIFLFLFVVEIPGSK